MKYKDYIDLKFERTDMNDSIEFEQTGYYGFCLSRELNNKVSIHVSGGELDKPKLYIKKPSGSTYHIIQMTGDAVRDLLTKSEYPDDCNPFSHLA